MIAPKHLVVVPTFRNDTTIVPLIREIQAMGLRCVVVDDGSPHPVTALLSENSLTCPVERHVVNKGKGSALKAGFNFARKEGYTHVITIDADGQHKTSDIPAILQASFASPHSLIIGKRDFANALGHVPRSSVFGQRFSDFWIWMETQTSVEDSQSGFRCYPLADLPDHQCTSTHYDLEVEILTRWLWSKKSVRSIDVQVSYLDDRVSSFKAFIDNFRFTILHTKLCVARAVGAGWMWSNTNRRSAEGNGTALTAKLVNILGTRVCYLLLPFVAFFYWLTVPHARSSMQDFYQRIGQKNPRCSPNWFTNFENTLNFSLSILDRVVFFVTGRLPPIDCRAIDPKKDLSGLTVLSAHFGDWTFSGLAFAKQYNCETLIVIDQTISPFMMSRIGKACGHFVKFIDRSVDAIELILTCRDVLRRGGSVCLMADRLHSKTPNDNQITASFLGEPLKLQANVFKLSLLLKRPVYFFSNTRQDKSSRPTYNLSAAALWDGHERLTEAELAQRYFTALEDVVLKNPGQWFNFFDYWGIDAATKQQPAYHIESMANH